MPTYTAEHMDQLIERHVAYRDALRKQGLIHPGQPTHALAGNLAAQQAQEAARVQQEAKSQESQAKLDLERQKAYVDRTTKQPLPTHEGFCVRCKSKVSGVVTRGEIRHKNGTRGVYGPCPNCDTPVHAFVKKEDASKPKSSTPRR